jgi:hypothetical protein
MCFVEERGCEGSVGNRSAKRQRRCAIVQERGGEDGVGRLRRLLAIEVKLGGRGGGGGWGRVSWAAF